MFYQLYDDMNYHLPKKLILEKFWTGHHDARDNLIRIIENFEQQGTLMPVWPKIKNLWLPIFMSRFDWQQESPSLNHALERLKVTTNWFQKIINENLSLEFLND